MIDVHRILLVVCLAACRLGFDRVEGGDDIAGDDAPPGDAARDGASDGADASSLSCPANYMVLVGVQNNSRYRVINNSREWDEAEAACEADGHHLAIPDNASELTAMYTALITQNIWIGVTDRVVEGTYRTVTGGIQTYLPWGLGEPDTDDCIFIDGLTTQLVAQDCDSGRRYICECDGAAAVPTSY